MAIDYSNDPCYNKTTVAGCVVKIVKCRRNITEIKRHPARYRNMSYIMGRLMEEGLISEQEMQQVNPHTNRLQLVKKWVPVITMATVTASDVIMNMFDIMQDVL